ncbi:hypothetical protein ACQR10_09795 [Bradyrhizobium sp. HKCCYLRH2060]|uniref:hypothetical protein n=1 Tax=Bradyrhizobium TaxID=374 RepID=UPI0029163C7B|nr:MULTISPECIES: hypothetical protein [unclassified Bradyrhizobium]
MSKTLTPTKARDLAIRLASARPDEALSVARGIEAPWFRCQALSHVARHWPDERYSRLLEEAILAADCQEDIFNRVAVSAWPIRAYLERGNGPPAKELLIKYVAASGAIENMGSRSEALFSIFQASKPFDTGLWRPVFWALVAAAEPALSWRQLRNLRDAVAIVASDHDELVHQVFEKLSEPKNLSTVRRYLGQHTRQQPRSYF